MNRDLAKTSNPEIKSNNPEIKSKDGSVNSFARSIALPSLNLI